MRPHRSASARFSKLTSRLLPSTAAAATAAGVLLYAGPLTTALTIAWPDAAPSASATTAVATAQVTIDDQAGILTPEDETALATDTNLVNLPESVRTVAYVTFEDNDDNLNDTVRYYTGDRGMQSGDKYADGLLIIAVGMDPQRMGVYCGEDVCRDLKFYDDSGETDELRVEAITDAMRPLLKDEKWEQGMLRGAQGAADTNLRNEPSNDGLVGAIVGGTFAVIGLGAAGTAIGVTRRKNATTAREDYEYIIAHHGDVAQRLEEINVRAHSLSSPLADNTMRSQWESIRRGFVDAHTSMDAIEGLSSSSSNAEFRKHRSALSKAREAVEEVVVAEENMEQLARMEHGDAHARTHELTTLHEDVLDATAKAKGQLVAELKDLDARLLAMRGEVDAPDFMDRFAHALGDYKVLIDALTDQMYEDSKTTRGTHSGPTLGSRDWHPGVGSYYYPYYTVSSWHDSDYQSSHSSSSGGVSTGYSGGGFSGGGGSSSF